MGDGLWWTLAAVGALAGASTLASSANVRRRSRRDPDERTALEALVARDRKLARIAHRIRAV